MSESGAVQLGRVAAGAVPIAFGVAAIVMSVKGRSTVSHSPKQEQIVGTPDDCITKLESAIDAGARQFWMSIHFDDKVRFMREWARRVMPAFR